MRGSLSRVHLQCGGTAGHRSGGYGDHGPGIFPGSAGSGLRMTLLVHKLSVPTKVYLEELHLNKMTCRLTLEVFTIIINNNYNSRQRFFVSSASIISLLNVSTVFYVNNVSFSPKNSN